MVIGTVISDEETPNFEKFRFRPAPNSSLAPGEFVTAKIAQNKYIIGRVVASLEINPHEEVESVVTRQTLKVEPDYPSEGESVIIYRVYEAEVIDELVADGTTFKTISIDTFVKSGSEIEVPSSEMVKEFLGLSSDPNDSYNIGKLEMPGLNTSTQDVMIKKNVIQRHLFIGGTTGSGKSYAAKVFMEEIHKKGIPIIIFDTQYEFTKLTEKLNGKVLVPEKDYTIKLSSLTVDEILNMVPVHNELHQEILEKSLVYLRKISKDFNLSQLLDKIKEIGTALGAEKSSNIVSTRTEDIINRSKYIGKGFAWESVLKKDAIVDINCRDYLRQDLQAILAATLRELKTQRESGKLPPFIIFIDEAHLFVPDDEETPCRQIIRENIRMGRHHGICVALITQSPTDIDKKVIRQCNTRLIFALEPDQLSAIQGIKADATTDMLNRLPKAKQGSGILTGTYETLKHALPVRIRELENVDTDSGKTPDIFAEINGTKEQ